MRTAAICPTCATYTNSICVLYDGPYLPYTGISPLDSVTEALAKIDYAIGALGGTTTTTSTTTTSYIVCATLGSASGFAVLASAAITNTGPTIITGDLGISPSTSVTGIPPGIVNGTQHINDTAATNARASALSAFTAFNALTPTASVPADIGGLTLTAGIYSSSSTLGITGVVTLNGGGNPNAVFIFKIPSTFIPAVGSTVLLTNGAQAGNIYWIVGSSATLNIGSYIKGNIIANNNVTLNTNAVLGGRAFSINGSVTMDTNNIIGVPCTVNPIPTSTTTTTTAVPTTTTTTTRATTTTTTTRATTTTTTTAGGPTTTTTTTSGGPTTTTTTTTAGLTTTTTTRAPGSTATIVLRNVDSDSVAWYKNGVLQNTFTDRGIDHTFTINVGDTFFAQGTRSNTGSDLGYFLNGSFVTIYFGNPTATSTTFVAIAGNTYRFEATAP